MMAWHIFRKDWRLLWPLAAGVALLQVLIMGLIRHSEPFPLLQWKSGTADLLTFALAVAMTLLMVLTVQQEAISSVNQDWLTRPIKRRDLLLSKLLNVALLIHGPIVFVNLLQGLLEGFSPGPVLLATLDSNFEIALCYTLPVMAVAAMTRSLIEAVVYGLVVGVIYLCAGIASPMTSVTGLVWIGRSLAHAELLLGTIAALVWQYFSRSREGTRQAQAVFLVAVILSAWTPWLPWGATFAIQRWFAANPQAGRPVSITVERGKFPRERQVLWEGDARVPVSDGFERFDLPVRFSGLPPGVILHSGLTTFRLLRGDGTVVYSGFGDPFELPADDPGMVQQSFVVSKEVLTRNGNQPLRLELEYFATLLRGKTVPTTVPLNDARRLPGFGWCAARGDREVEVGCRQIGALPFCISLRLGQGPEKFVCELNYEPVPLRFSVDPIDHMHTTLPHADGEAVTITVYEPEDHFSRKVVIPEIRLKDRSP